MSNVQPIRLGELIKLLEQAGTHDVSYADGKPRPKSVRFDFCGCSPCQVDSYRGYYDHLAMGWERRDWGGANGIVDAPHLLDNLKGAIGQMFCGYKGGEYVMDERTPVWVDNDGECSSTAVTGIRDRGWCIVITTGYCEDWAG